MCVFITGSRLACCSFRLIAAHSACVWAPNRAHVFIDGWYLHLSPVSYWYCRATRPPPALARAHVELLNRALEQVVGEITDGFHKATAKLELPAAEDDINPLQKSAEKELEKVCGAG